LSDMVDSRIAWLLQFESGRIWYNKLTSDETKRMYLRNLERYCKAVKKTPDELVELKMEGQRNIGTMKEFQAETLLETFFANCRLKESAKAALKTAIISFYKHNRRELASNTASNIVAPEPKKRCPETNDIIALENAMTTARDKAIVWFLASTAVRVGTLTKLRWNDLQPTDDPEVPYQMVIESSRLKGSGVGRFRGLKQVAFLHKLAAAKLENYKIELSRKKYVVKEDSPLFIAYRKSKKLGTYFVIAKLYRPKSKGSHLG